MNAEQWRDVLALAESAQKAAGIAVPTVALVVYKDRPPSGERCRVGGAGAPLGVVLNAIPVDGKWRVTARVRTSEVRKWLRL